MRLYTLFRLRSALHICSASTFTSALHSYLINHSFSEYLLQKTNKIIFSNNCNNKIKYKLNSLHES